MRTVALIPAKRLAEAKTRLAPELSGEERAALSLAMLRHVLEQVRQLEGLAAYGVLSGDEQLLALAANLGATAIPEHAGGLNRALDVGREWAFAQGAEALLVVLSDLPLVSHVDLAEVLNAGETQPGVAIAPSTDGGTNALLLRPAEAIPFRFGRDSARYHTYEAGKRGLRVARVERPSVSFDVDTPADLAAYRAAAGQRAACPS
jgi:2-phospho-L-lactate guanylyltransferase